MSSESQNSWWGLVANGAVLIGILFVAYELRQNTIATRLDVASSFQSSFSGIEMLIAGNPEFASLLMKERQGEEVSETEQFRLGVFYTNALRQWQFVHFQYLVNALDEDIWRGQRSYFEGLISANNNLVKHWEGSEQHYSPRFNALMEAMAAAK